MIGKCSEFHLWILDAEIALKLNFPVPKGANSAEFDMDRSYVPACSATPIAAIVQQSRRQSIAPILLRIVGCYLALSNWTAFPTISLGS